MLTLAGLFVLILLGGVAARSTFYRTLFYTPPFTSGVATFILWKKLYSPHTVPINQALTPLLDGLNAIILSLTEPFCEVMHWALLLMVIVLFSWSCRRLIRSGSMAR